MRVGPPAFDGGALAGTFRVEWDTVSTFNRCEGGLGHASTPTAATHAPSTRPPPPLLPHGSGPSGQALGGASVPALTTLCTACVREIAFQYNNAQPVVTVHYNGSADTVRQLQTGARVVVVTTDDHLPYR